MNKMSFKDSIVTAKQFSAVNMTTGKTIWFSRSRSPQHLYPLTEKDYCEAVKYTVQHGINQMPILSVYKRYNKSNQKRENKNYQNWLLFRLQKNI